MSLRFRYSAGLLAAAALLTLGCEGDIDSNDTTADVGTEDAAGDTGDVADDADTGPGDDADTGPDDGDEPDPLEPADPSLWLQIDPVWVEHDIRGGSTSVDCRYRDGNGLLKPDQPDDIEIEVQGYEDVDEDGRYSFAEAGVYEVSCSSESLELQTDGEIIVAFEGLDFRFVDLAERIGAMEQHWLELAALLDEDEPHHEDIEEVLDELQQTADGLTDELPPSLLVEHPDGWPQLDDLEDQGFNPGSDDEQFGELLDELIDEHEAYRQALGGLSLDMTDEEMDAVESSLVELHLAIDQFGELDPSEHAVWANRQQLPALLEQLAVTAEFQVDVVTGLATEQPVNASLVGQIGVAALKVGWDRFGFTAMSLYRDLLEDAGKAITASVVNMTIAGVFDHFISPLPGAPHISAIHGSAAGFVCSGVPFTAVGSFQTPPDRNTFYFIPPASVYPLFEAADLVSQLNDLKGALNNAAENLNIVTEVMFYNELEKTISGIMGFTTPDAFIVDLQPESGDQEFLEFGALPPDMNPGSFPAVGTFFPVDGLYGFGAAHEVNVVQGECG